MGPRSTHPDLQLEHPVNGEPSAREGRADPVGRTESARNSGGLLTTLKCNITSFMHHPPLHRPPVSTGLAPSERLEGSPSPRFAWGTPPRSCCVCSAVNRGSWRQSRWRAALHSARGGPVRHRHCHAPFRDELHRHSNQPARDRGHGAGRKNPPRRGPRLHHRPVGNPCSSAPGAWEAQAINRMATRATPRRRWCGRGRRGWQRARCRQSRRERRDRTPRRGRSRARRRAPTSRPCSRGHACGWD